jgi:hypothetical protein
MMNTSIELDRLLAVVALDGFCKTSGAASHVIELVRSLRQRHLAVTRTLLKVKEVWDVNPTSLLA